MSLAQYPLMPQRRLHLGDGPSSTANGLGQSTHEAQHTTNWQQYLSRSSNELISRYTHASPWNPSTTIWPENTALSADFRSVDAGPRLSVSSLSKQGHYLESSQRTSLPSYSSSQPLLSNLPLPAPSERRHTPASTPKLNELWGSNLYTIEDTEPSGLPSRNDTCTPSVKQEPDDGFIMEFTNSSSSPSVVENSLAPPTEVPLRATQASKEMRKMMGVFRLNPFTMHNAGARGTHVPSWNGEDAGPLSEEPQLYEFQLILNDVEVEPASEERFSPDFEIVNDNAGGTDNVPRNEWPEYHARELSPSSSQRLPSLWDNSSSKIELSPTGTSASLELEYPDQDQDQGGDCLSLIFFLSTYSYSSLASFYQPPSSTDI
jgi:hypothetical protein